MPRYIKKIWSGDVYEVEEYYSPRKVGKKYERGKNELLTTEEQAEMNLKWARKKLCRKINANFKKGDIFITLTHREKVDYKEAKKELSKFLRRLKRKREKQGIESLKYIAVTECQDKREHHHLIVNEIDLTMKEWACLWGLGRVMISRLEPGGDYTGLAMYITKECRMDNSKRWSCSRNLKEPKIKIKEEKEEKKSKRMQPPKGYKEVERFEYISDRTGCVKYLKAMRIGGADYGEGGK